jgi:TonB family protein
VIAASLLLLLAAEPEAGLDEPAAAEAKAAVVASAHVATRAKQMVRTLPVYPKLELRRGREAWVHITYCIDESGNVQNITILDSVGNDSFDKAAINTVEQWKFEPATQDGEPVWQSRNDILVNFAIEDEERAATRKFVTKYRQLERLIDDDELETADKWFWTIYDTFDLSMYELAKLWSQRARYEIKSGDLYKLELALSRATASHGEWIEKKSYLNLLAIRTRVELQLGKYREARDSYDELIIGAGEDAEDVIAMRPMFDKLQALIDSDQILKISAEVRARGECAYCNDSWHFLPVRNDFTFANIKGTLDSIDMRCDHKRFESDVKELVEWHIPDSWGRCQVHIYGEPGTTFDVMMLAASDD